MEKLSPADTAKVLRFHKASAAMVSFALRHTGKRITRSGADNIPKESFIAAFSHHNSQDFIGLSCDLLWNGGPLIRYMAKEDLFQKAWMTGLLGLFGVIPVTRNELNFGQLKEAADLVKNGQSLGIAPEGGRIAGDKLAKLAKGVGYIAVLANKPVVPVSIVGQNLVKDGKPRWWIPRSLHVRYGQPIQPENVEVDLDELKLITHLPKSARHAAHDVNKQLAENLGAAFETAYEEYEEIYGSNAAALLDRSPKVA